MSTRHDSADTGTEHTTVSSQRVASAAGEAFAAYADSLAAAGLPGPLAYAEGRVWEMTGDSQAALGSFRRALQDTEALPSPRLLNAVVRSARSSGLEEETASWLARGAEDGSCRPEVGLWAGHLFRACGRLERAAEVLKRCAFAVDEPSVRYPATTELLSALLELGWIEAAIKVCRLAIDWFPERSSALHVDRAGLLVRIERHREALAELDRVVASEPSHSGAHFIRGAALLRLGRRAEAERALRRAVALDSSLSAPLAELLAADDARDGS